MLFLSYAEEDRQTASIIADWLGNEGFVVYRWEDPERRGKRFIQQIEEAISESEAFLALLSPSFLRSNWCRRERELALQRELDLQADEPDRNFVHVLQIAATPNRDTGFFRSYDWMDLTNQTNMDAELLELASRLRPGDKPEPTPSPAVGTSQPALSSSESLPPFRNRNDELDRVLRGLTNASGPHFWLVIAPPQLGKTWFLQRVSDDAALSVPPSWVTRLIDLHEQPADVRGDAGAVLASIFGRTSPLTVGATTNRSIAQEISKSGQPHLCLLDGAELLEKETAVALRACLSQIYRLVQDAGNSSVRLAFIVASRREEEWRGVTPSPRLCSLPLTEFTPDVVQQALRELALEMGRAFSAAELRNNARLVYRLTEGLPALLVRCLQWIQDEQWVEMDRLESQELFEELVDSYIKQGLLTRESLYPHDEGPPGEPLHALEQAFRVLAPYRLFTQSHLRNHLGSDPAFRAALTDQRWSIEDLWKAISGTALLARPLNEPWQQIQAAIRRLLHRYYYHSDENRAEAHSDARKFVEVWADKQSGKEQVIGLVECLWHEAIALGLRDPAEIEQALSQSARTLCSALRASSAYTPQELRGYAAELMENDEELQEAVSKADGLFARLVEIVATTPEEL
jgi:TIR domain